VRLANDARELQRRDKEQEIRKALLKKLEEDDEECMKKYKEINEKWSGIVASKDPLDIHAEMEAQNARCMEIIARKDAIIAELQLELENADLKFLDDQKILNEDINLLIDRMDNQVSGIYIHLLAIGNKYIIDYIKTRNFYLDKCHDKGLPSRIIAY